MFVKENSVKAIKEYFKKELVACYEERDITQFIKQSICERFNWTTTDYILGDEQRLSESDLLFFREIAKRLLNHEPFQYIIGKVTFHGLDLTIDHRALVPRPETEEMVAWIAQEINFNEQVKILDVCTGSGCIALALRSLGNQAEVIGVDKALDALTLARKNAEQLIIPVDFFQMDALDENQYKIFKENDFDCWVSNPPYIPEKEKKVLPENVVKFEPHVALFVPDSDPIIFYKGIALQALKYLKKSALLFFEIHEDLANDVICVLDELGFVNIELRKDLQGKNRLLKAQKP